MVTTDHEVATQPSGAAIAGSLVAFAWKATSILHDIRVLDGQAGREAAASGSPAGAKGAAGVVARFVAWIAAAIADELRIRRDMRQLRAMDDCMLQDIGLTRADIGTAVRYGRDLCGQAHRWRMDGEDWAGVEISTATADPLTSWSAARSFA
jgi:uncharacterized protein YjiS (DUF1127 family)